MFAQTLHLSVDPFEAGASFRPGLRHQTSSLKSEYSSLRA